MPSPIHLSKFADITDLSDDQVKEIIARVGRDDLTVALKAATEPVKDKILGNMSKEERQALTQYMEWLGPMRLSEVEVVQWQIVNKFKDASRHDAFVLGPQNPGPWGPGFWAPRRRRRGGAAIRAR